MGTTRILSFKIEYMILNILLTVLLFNMFLSSEPEYLKEYMIASSVNPLYVYWIDESNILVSDIESSFTFDLVSREKKDLESCESCITGYDEGVIYCEYVHRMIQSEEEFSTTIIVKDLEFKVLNTFELFPTVIPVVCKRDWVVAKSAYAFLEQRKYLIQSRGIGEVENRKSKDMKGLINYTVSNDKERMVGLDEYNILWMYRKK